MSELRSPLASLLLGLLFFAPPVGAEAVDDPMRPPHMGPGVAAPAAPSYQLSSVLIGAERRIAVINGRALTVGDRVGPAVITDIQPSTVTLSRGGRSFTVSLVEVDVKQTAKKPQQ